MPIEIKELTIRARVRDEESGASGNRNNQNRPNRQNQQRNTDDRRTMEQVAEMLKRQKER